VPSCTNISLCPGQSIKCRNMTHFRWGV